MASVELVTWAVLINQVWYAGMHDALIGDPLWNPSWVIFVASTTSMLLLSHLSDRFLTKFKLARSDCMHASLLVMRRQLFGSATFGHSKVWKLL
jgi:hypothetical protein